MQADRAIDGKRRYSGLVDAFRTIVKAEGVTGLWKGLGPNIQRAFLVNAAELST